MPRSLWATFHSTDISGTLSEDVEGGRRTIQVQVQVKFIVNIHFQVSFCEKAHQLVCRYNTES